MDGNSFCLGLFLVLWHSVCITAVSLFGFYGLFNAACACCSQDKWDETMNNEKGNENFFLSFFGNPARSNLAVQKRSSNLCCDYGNIVYMTSVCHTMLYDRHCVLYEQVSLSLRKQHCWYIFMSKACWVIALIIFIAYEQLLGLLVVFLVPGVKKEPSNEQSFFYPAGKL